MTSSAIALHALTVCAMRPLSQNVGIIAESFGALPVSARFRSVPAKMEPGEAL
jgi:hypothetical protein